MEGILESGNFEVRLARWSSRHSRSRISDVSPSLGVRDAVGDAGQETENNEQEIMKKLRLIEGTFVTILLLNLGRFICSRWCMDFSWYQRILYDDIHHYQLGIVLLGVGFLLSRYIKRIRPFLFGIGLGLILDESFFVVELFGLPPYFNESVFRWATFDAIAFLLFLFGYQRWKKFQFEKQEERNKKQ
jgi:hypothetical protein